MALVVSEWAGARACTMSMTRQQRAEWHANLFCKQRDVAPRLSGMWQSEASRCWQSLPEESKLTKFSAAVRHDFFGPVLYAVMSV